MYWFLNGLDSLKRYKNHLGFVATSEYLPSLLELVLPLFFKILIAVYIISLAL